MHGYVYIVCNYYSHKNCKMFAMVNCKVTSLYIDALEVYVAYLISVFNNSDVTDFIVTAYTSLD